MTDSLDQLLATFRERLYLPDPMPLHGMLAALVANRLPGDPVWLLLVGPPSCGKTELLNTLDHLPGIWRFDVATEAGLMTAGRDGTLGGVLGEITADGGMGILVVKDLSTILAEGANRRAALFADLRRIYDGEWERRVGKAGGTTLRFEGHVGLLGATTDAIDQLANEIGELGPRMLFLRMPDTDTDEQLQAVSRNVGHQRDVRATLADTVANFVATLNFTAPSIEPSTDRPELRALAQWATWAHSPVSRNRWGDHEIEYVPRPEIGGRLLASLLQLHAGARLIGLDETTTTELIRTIALDVIPSMRARVLDYLSARPGLRPTTRTVADAVGLPTPITSRACEDLAALGIVERSAEAQGGEHHWSLTATARTVADRAQLVPEQEAGV
jgi:hypothetical protein